MLLVLLACRGEPAPADTADRSPDTADPSPDTADTTFDTADSSADTAPPDVVVHVSPDGCDTCAGTEADPLLTLAAAIDAAAVLLADGPVTIALAAGVYPTYQAVTLDEAHTSATHTLTIRGDDALLSGGRPVGAFTQRDGAVYEAVLPALPDGARPSFLWPDPATALPSLTRSRTPDFDLDDSEGLPGVTTWYGGAYHRLTLEDPFDYDDATQWGLPEATTTAIPDLAIEVVTPFGWTISRLPVAYYVHAWGGAWVSPPEVAGAMEFARPYGPVHVDGGLQSYYLSGTWPDREGEYAFDWSAGTALVYTEGDAALLDGAVVPVQDTLLALSGAREVVIEGLRFSHAGDPAPTNGFIGWAGDYYADPDSADPTAPVGRYLAAAVTVTGGSGVAFRDCAFIDLGARGVQVWSAADVTFEGNTFARIAGGGLTVYGTTGVTIEGNTFEDIGHHYAADALTTYAGTGGWVHHNAFADLGGRAWYAVTELFTVGETVVFEYNRVDRATQAISDAGALNFGAAGHVVRANHITGIEQESWDLGVDNRNKAFYLDIGTYATEVSGNVVEDSAAFIQGNCQTGNVVTDNYADADENTPLISYIACDYWDHPLLDAAVAAYSTPQCNANLNCLTDTVFENNENAAIVADVTANAGP